MAFFSLKYVAIWGVRRERMCVVGGCNRFDKAYYFSPVGLSPIEIRKEQKGFL